MYYPNPKLCTGNIQISTFSILKMMNKKNQHEALKRVINMSLNNQRIKELLPQVTYTSF